MHDILRISIQPLAAFGSPLKGDTLFGQLCWAIHNRFGEERLNNLLEDYTSGNPFVVLSDGLPTGYLPKPTLPIRYFELPPEMDQKQFKRHAWVPLQALEKPLSQWLQFPVITELDAVKRRQQPHNSINRRSGTTGEDFAPYTVLQTWYPSGARLDLYAVLNNERLTQNEFISLMNDIGNFGFGRDASIGLGKFALGQCEPVDWPHASGANACLTLAPCAPQNLGLQSERCFYEIFTRFGRHGDQGVHKDNPFKSPVLLADTGGVFCPASSQGFIGQGLGGNGQLSKTIETTVHQGYAPAVPIHLPDLQDEIL